MATTSGAYGEFSRLTDTCVIDDRIHSRSGGAVWVRLMKSRTPRSNCVLLFVCCRFVEEVVGRVRHEYPLAHIADLNTSSRGRGPSQGVYPLDERRLCQPVTAGGSGLS